MKPLLKNTAFIICFFLIFSVQLFAEDGGGDDDEESNKEIECKITGDEVILIDKSATYTADIIVTKGEGAEGGSTFRWTNPSGIEGATITYSDTATVKSETLKCIGTDGEGTPANGTKTIHIVDPTVMFIKAESQKAICNEYFTGHETYFGDPCAKDNPGQALIIFRNDVANNNGSIDNFDIKLSAIFDPYFGSPPHNILDESWSKVSSPASGSFNKHNTFDVKFQNPKVGGLYKIRFNFLGKEPSGANILLPLAGPEMKDWLNSEVRTIKEWCADVRRQHILYAMENNQKLWNENLDLIFIQISRKLNYTCVPKGAFNVPSERFAKEGKWYYITACGEVVFFSKLNNLLWGVFASNWGYSKKVALKCASGANFITTLIKNFPYAKFDSETAKNGINLGQDIYKKLEKNRNADLSDLICKNRMKDLVDDTELHEERLWPLNESVITQLSDIHKPPIYPSDIYE